MLEFYEGLLKIANVVLSLVAGYFALTLIKASEQRKELRSWQALIGALVFFAIQEILGALRAFGIYSSSFLTHIVPGVVLALLIYALAWQIHINITQK